MASGGSEMKARIVKFACIAITVFLYGASLTIALTGGTNRLPSPLTWDEMSPRVLEWTLAAAVGFTFALLTAWLVEEETREKMRSEYKKLSDSAELIIKSVPEILEEIKNRSTEQFGSLIFGQLYNKEVFERTIDRILKTPLYREDYVHLIEFSSAPIKEVVKLTHTVTYSVINSSTISDANYDMYMTFDDLSMFYPEEFGYVCPKVTRVSIDNEESSGDEIARINNSRHGVGGGDGQTHYEIQIGSRVIPKSGGKMRVKIVYHTIEPADSQWVNTTFFAIKDLKIEIMNDVEGLNVLIIPIGYYEFENKIYNFENTNKSWSVSHKGVVLPNSGWNLRWAINRAN